VGEEVIDLGVDPDRALRLPRVRRHQVDELDDAGR
jgi:hypothetical protein